jgi:hypothetical protein
MKLDALSNVTTLNAEELKVVARAGQAAGVLLGVVAWRA